MANKQNQKRRGKYQIDEITYAKGGYSKCVHMRARERGVEKSVIRYVRTSWMVSNKCYEIFFVHWSGQVHQSITASKENVVVFFHHNYDYFIFAIIRIYTVLHIYLHVSETEGLAELHWVIGLSVLEKINSIYFYGISFVLSRISVLQKI